MEELGQSRCILLFYFVVQIMPEVVFLKFFLVIVKHIFEKFQDHLLHCIGSWGLYRGVGFVDAYKKVHNFWQ